MQLRRGEIGITVLVTVGQEINAVHCETKLQRLIQISMWALLLAGFTATDVLALGALGHAIGVGIVLGLKGIGAL